MEVVRILEAASASLKLQGAPVSLAPEAGVSGTPARASTNHHPAASGNGSANGSNGKPRTPASNGRNGRLALAEKGHR